MSSKFIKIISVFFLLSLAAGCTRAATTAMPETTLVPTLALPTSAANPASPVPSATAAAADPTADPSLTPVQAEPPTSLPSPTVAPVELVGAGDIAYCGAENQGDEITANLLERFPNAAIFTAGDNVYGDGTGAELRNCFGPSWGRFKDRIHPSPGNHDYMTDSGAPYFAYFGDAAGPAGLGYYSYDLGDWHIVVLNSNCNDIACGSSSPQVKWFKEDLQKSAKQCTLAYWHHPRWSSGIAGGSGSVSSFWRTAVEMGVDVVVNGHDHDYERFAPQDGDGNPSPTGTREFVVGTGGAELRDRGQMKPNSEVMYTGVNGVIKFSLYPGRYDWQFVPATDDAMTDSGSNDCH